MYVEERDLLPLLPTDIRCEFAFRRLAHGELWFDELWSQKVCAAVSLIRCFSSDRSTLPFLPRQATIVCLCPQSKVEQPLYLHLKPSHTRRTRGPYRLLMFLYSYWTFTTRKQHNPLPFIAEDPTRRPANLPRATIPALGARRLAAALPRPEPRDRTPVPLASQVPCVARGCSRRPRFTILCPDLRGQDDGGRAAAVVEGPGSVAGVL